LRIGPDASLQLYITETASWIGGASAVVLMRDGFVGKRGWIMAVLDADGTLLNW
jgi:hypothetical protein